MDGLNYGTSNIGPGRRTLYSMAPGNEGIDLNRCWQSGNYQMFTGRNYNGTAPFQAYEAQYLRNFLLNHKSQNGQTLLIDLHGWEQSLIGDGDICACFRNYFPENISKVGSYGTGYLIGWARSNLGSSKGAAKTALIELPNIGQNAGHQTVLNHNLSNRYIESMFSVLRNL